MSGATKETFFVGYRWGAYFRIAGYGAAAQRDLPRYFSERYGYRKVWRVGRWAFQLLNRGR